MPRPPTFPQPRTGGTEPDRSGRYRPDRGLVFRRWLLLVGPKCREQFCEPPVGHLEDGQRLHEELRCRPGDVLELVRGSVGLEHVQQHEVMDPGQIENAQALADRPSAKLVGCPASRLTTLGKVLKEGRRVVTPEPLLGVPGNVAPCRVGPSGACLSSRCR